MGRGFLSGCWWTNLGFLLRQTPGPEGRCPELWKFPCFHTPVSDKMDLLPEMVKLCIWLPIMRGFDSGV